MKYFIINSDGKEYNFDLYLSGSSKRDMVAFEVKGPDSSSKYFLKSVAGKNFVSRDKLNWEKLPKVADISFATNAQEQSKMFRGFKPSGMGSQNAGELKTDMPGKVVKILTTEGAVVNQGDTLLILEAMKMENEIKSGVDGVIKSVHVSEGQTIESGTLMIEIEE